MSGLIPVAMGVSRLVSRSVSMAASVRLSQEPDVDRPDGTGHHRAHALHRVNILAVFGRLWR